MKRKTGFAVPVALFAVAFASPLPAAGQTKGTVVEEIVARVNNEIITLTDYKKA